LVSGTSGTNSTNNNYQVFFYVFCIKSSNIVPNVQYRKCLEIKEMVEQIIIAAGGMGSRMSEKLNPYKSKPLIESNGKPLIYYLILFAKEAGIKDFFISVNRDNKDTIDELSKSLGIKCLTRLTGDSFSKVPSLFADCLDEKFLVVCGHDPVPTEHILKLIEKAKDCEMVATAYSNECNKTQNKMRIVVNNPESQDNNETYYVKDLNVDILPENHFYSRNPYVISKDILGRTANDGFKKNAGYYIYQLWSEGKKVATIKATMPVEFDTDIEFLRTINFLDNYLKSHK
jgi:NDP-sugar pyrophosphorylase family protein